MNRSLPRILFVGNDYAGSNATSLRNAFLHIGCHVSSINTLRWSSWAHRHWALASRLAPAATADVKMRAVSESIWRAVSVTHYDMLVVFKGNEVASEIVANFPGSTVHYHPDDSANPDNVTPTYLEAEPHYNLLVTTKRHNVPELARRSPDAEVLFVWCAYDRNWHLARGDASSFSMRVGFIGTRRPERAAVIQEVARRCEEVMVVRGGGWGRDRVLTAIADVGPEVFASNYLPAVRRASVQLGFLNSANRDRHTCRTFEVPAAGGLLVAERTEEHLELFEDGVEALFFSDEDELHELLRRVAREPLLAGIIAAAGRRRVSGQDYEARARQILAAVGMDVEQPK